MFLNAFKSYIQQMRCNDKIIEIWLPFVFYYFFLRRNFHADEISHILSVCVYMCVLKYMLMYTFWKWFHVWKLKLLQHFLAVDIYDSSVTVLTLEPASSESGLGIPPWWVEIWFTDPLSSHSHTHNHPSMIERWLLHDWGDGGGGI